MREKEQKSEGKSKKWLWIALAIFSITVVASYIIGYTYFKERFFVNTELNGMDVSQKTVQEVIDIYQKKGDSYNLMIQENETVLLDLHGTDINLQYKVESLIKSKFAKQNPYLWWRAYFSETKESISENIFYDTEKLKELLSKETFLPESGRTAPKSAEIVYDGEKFVIQKEQAGTQLDAEKLEKAVADRISGQNVEKLDLAAEECYILPQYTEQSPEVVKACEQMNGYCNAQITYNFFGMYTEQVGKDKIAQWVTLGEDWQTGLNQDAVRQYLNTLAETYRGQMDVEKELPVLVSAIQNQEVKERTPEPDLNIYGGRIGAGTYIEVDLTNQHMWYVEKGKVLLSCDVVTGLPTNARRTPAGNYRITEKMRNKILTGNIVPETGEPEYRTKVSYWMRITNSGVGFHDATWQPSFGGQRYKRHGSHGCINMPYSAAQQLYSLVSVGTRTVIHY